MKPQAAGRQYEDWLAEQIVPLGVSMGVFAMTDTPRVKLRVPMQGKMERHEIDLVAECDDTVLLVQAKRCRKLKYEAGLHDIYSIIDVAHRLSGRDVHGLVLTTSEGENARLQAELAGGIIARPASLAGPVRLLHVPAASVGGLVPAVSDGMENPAIYFSFATPADTGDDVERLVSELRNHADPEVRFRASASLVSSRIALPESRVEGLQSVANLALHLGLGATALRAAATARCLAPEVAPQRLRQIDIIENMARFRVAYDGGARSAPARGSLKRLTRTFLEAEGNEECVGVGSFIGAWHGLFGSPEDAVRVLEEVDASLQRATKVGALYRRLVNKVRLADLLPLEERRSAAAELAPLLSDLSPTHRPLAIDLLTRFDAGEDVSIAATFWRSSVQRVGPK